MFSPLFRFPSLRLITATAAALTLPLASFALNGKAMREALVADYPLTQVGLVMINNDYTRIMKPGVVLAVRLPGIYADVANTKSDIVNTDYSNRQISHATGFSAAFGGSTAQPRLLNPNDKVYVTSIYVKRDAVQLGSLAHCRCHNARRWKEHALSRRVERQNSQPRHRDSR